MHEVIAVQIPEADVEPYVAEVRDKALQYSLQHGVGFLHKTMAPADQAAVGRLFASGAVQVRVL